MRGDAVTDVQSACTQVCEPLCRDKLNTAWGCHMKGCPMQNTACCAAGTPMFRASCRDTLNVTMA